MASDQAVPAAQAADGPMVRIRDAGKRYPAPDGGFVQALHSVSLDVGANEFVTLLGPSGCGKTTLLRTISGFEVLDQGSLAIAGQPMDGLPPHRRPVNTVFQNYALFPHLSVGDNIGYGLAVAGCPRAERRKRTAAALELVGLAGLERRRPRQLSGGQQQRVALARAIVNRPRVLLLDEPLSALDRNLREAMQVELKTLQHELGIAFVFVTHDQQEALTMSDRIVVMEAGRICQIGTPTEVYDQPGSVFVARFVGEGNLCSGHLQRRAGGLTCVTGNGSVLRLADQETAIEGERHVLIRPEDLEVVDPETADDPERAVLAARVEQTLFGGADFQVFARTDDGLALKAMVRDPVRRLGPSLQPGQRIGLRYRLGAVRLIPVEANPA